MRVLITGAYGFIGMHVVAALLRAGHVPVAAVRGSRAAMPGMDSVACDFTRDVDAAAWRPRLAGIDAVVNCAGILREARAGDFERVHATVPLALAQACRDAGVRRLVQVSALGDPRDAEFVASKHRGDEAILRSGIDAVVLRPSVVYSTRGSYGGTTLLRGLAALPLIPLPGAARRGCSRWMPRIWQPRCSPRWSVPRRPASAWSWAARRRSRCAATSACGGAGWEWARRDSLRFRARWRGSARGWAKRSGAGRWA